MLGEHSYWLGRFGSTRHIRNSRLSLVRILRWRCRSINPPRKSSVSAGFCCLNGEEFDRNPVACYLASTGSPSLVLARIFQLVWSDVGFTAAHILRRPSRFCKVCTMAEIHTDGHERRKRARINIRYSVRIDSSQGVLSGQTKNISRSGALIACACREPLLPGVPLDLTIKRPSAPSIETSARVVWCSVPGFRGDSLICRIGVRFTQS